MAAHGSVPGDDEQGDAEVEYEAKSGMKSMGVR